MQAIALFNLQCYFLRRFPQPLETYYVQYMHVKSPWFFIRGRVQSINGGESPTAWSPQSPCKWAQRGGRTKDPLPSMAKNPQNYYVKSLLYLHTNHILPIDHPNFFSSTHFISMSACFCHFTAKFTSYWFLTPKNFNIHVHCMILVQVWEPTCDHLQAGMFWRVQQNLRRHTTHSFPVFFPLLQLHNLHERRIGI